MHSNTNTKTHTNIGVLTIGVLTIGVMIGVLIIGVLTIGVLIGVAHLCCFLIILLQERGLSRKERILFGCFFSGK